MFEFLGDAITNETAAHLEYLKGRRQYRPARFAKNPFDTTQEDIAELRLYLAVLTRLLLAKKLISGEELKEWLAAVDASDGERDGALKGPIAPESR